MRSAKHLPTCERYLLACTASDGAVSSFITSFTAAVYHTSSFKTKFLYYHLKHAEDLTPHRIFYTAFVYSVP